MSIREDIIKEIIEERGRQDKKFGEQNHNPIEWLTILMEEVGEASKAAGDKYFCYNEKIKSKKFDYSEYRKEMIQVAAVAFSMIECFDRNKK